VPCKLQQRSFFSLLVRRLKTCAVSRARSCGSPPFGDLKSDYFLMCCAEVPDSEGPL
jgi:hypothetical protein